MRLQRGTAYKPNDESGEMKLKRAIERLAWRYRRLVVRLMSWAFPWLISEPVMSLTEFNRQELWKWITPNEFSFGPDGWLPGLQPVPYQFRKANTDVSTEAHRLRCQLAIMRRDLGLPPIFWMKETPR